MSLSLISNATAIAKGGKVPFQAIGGVEPYLYSVMAGGVGGTINPSGIYSSPTQYGIDTIKVVDASLAEATKQIMVLAPIGLIAEIIQRQMGLPQSRVWIFDQKFKEPTDYDLFIVLQELSLKPFGSSVVGDLQWASFQSTMSIDIKSRNTSAMYQKEEVVMALKSTYSEQQQELNSFSIASIPSAFVNLSQVDGMAIPYQYNITFNVLYSMQLSKVAPYYDSFEDVEILTNE